MDELRVENEFGEAVLYYREHELIRFKPRHAASIQGVKHAVSLALLAHKEAICERLETILACKSMTAYGHHTVDASGLRALVTAIRGEK